MFQTHDMEYLCDYTIFQRQSMIYRTSDLLSKVIDTDSLVLPKNVMLHVIDNLAHSSSSTDDFEIAKYPLFTDKGTKKFLFNIRDFDTVSKDDLAMFTSRIYRPRLVENIRNFMKVSRAYMIPTLQLDTVLANKNVAVVINYNPLYRIVSTNSRPINEYHRYRAIMATVLKNTTLYDRLNMIVVPVPDNFSYMRSNVMSMVANDTVSSQKLLNTSHFYFLFVELAAWLVNHEAQLPIFSRLTSRELDKVSIMFVSGTKYVIANFGKLALLVDNRMRAFQFLDNIVSISTKTDIGIKPADVVVYDKVSWHYPEGKCPSLKLAIAHFVTIMNWLEKNNLLSEEGKALVALGINEGFSLTSAMVTEEGNTILSDHYQYWLNSISYTNDVSMKVLEDGLHPQSIPTTDTVVKDEVIDNKPITKSLAQKPGFVTNIEIEPPTDEDEDEPEVKYELFDEINDQLNQEDDTPIKDIQVIAKPPVVTPKQQNFIAVLAAKHRTIKVNTHHGTKTLGDILDKPVEMSVGTESYTQLTDTLKDTSMVESSTRSFDRKYVEQVLQKDIISSLVSFHDNGLYLTDYEETNEYNEFTRVKHFKVRFQDIKGKKHTLRFKVPMPDRDGYYKADGVNLTMTKQLVNLPICKISPTRVSLVSNYNKTLVDKVQSTRHSLVEFITKNVKELGLIIVPRSNSYVRIDVPYEYKLVGSKITQITSSTHEFFFDYTERANHFKIAIKDLTKYEDSKHANGVLIGRVIKHKDEYLFMHTDNTISVINIVTGNIISKESIVSYLGINKVPAEWCELKILDKNIPIVFILAYRYGLSEILKHIGAKYRIVRDRSLDIKPTELVITFSDCKLVIDRYPIKSSYIVAGLLAFSSLKRYAIAELDDQDTFFNLLSDKGMSTNYLKGITAYFNFFIDPITKSVLEEMHEPTNTRDLLIRAVDMLVTKVDIEPSALANYRVRSTEKIPAIIYNEISRQYANYVSSNFRESTFSINTEAVYQRILQDQTMTLREENNPFHAMKETSKVTYAGFGGRTPDSFVERDRKYPDDAVGILAETTTDSSSAGMNSALTGDPKLLNMRGMFDIANSNLSITNTLGETSLLMPGTTHDDPKRNTFCNIQLTHHIPTKHQQPMRMRTGYELVVPHKTSRNFVAKSRYDGVISSIDDNLKFIIVKYKDGSTENFQYGDVLGESPGMSVNHHIEYMSHLKVGVKVKAGDIITYSDDFFHLDPVTNELAWCHGTQAKVAIMAKDVTLEDSSMISAGFAEKMKFDSVYDRCIQLTTDMEVDEYVKVGDTVKFDTVLMKLKYTDTANLIGDTDDIFDDLKQVEYRSKHEGIVSGIKVYYTSDELSEPLTKFISQISYQSRRKFNASKDSINADDFKFISKVNNGTKIKGIQLGEEDILVIFYIQSSVACGIGDKIILDSSLKTVIGKVETEPMMTESGEEIDVVFSASSVFNRIILSPIISGCLERVLAQAEEEVLEIYFK